MKKQVVGDDRCADQSEYQRQILRAEPGNQQPPSDATLIYWRGPFIQDPEQLLDSWGNQLWYDCPGTYNPDSYDLISAGPDGEFWTSDDITNWTPDDA